MRGGERLLPSECGLRHWHDDNFCISKNTKIGKTVFDILLQATLFLGGKISKKKILKNKHVGVILGMLFDIKRLGAMCMPPDKAVVILSLLDELMETCGLMEFKKIERLVGKLSWAAYFSTFGTRHALPLIALKWMPPMMRKAVITQVGHPMYDETRRAIKWWRDLLTSENKVLWRRSHDPKEWRAICSDASESAWAVYDYRSSYYAGAFDNRSDDNIATLEMETVTKYLKFAKPNKRSGFLLICDNMQVVHAIHKGSVRSGTCSKFRKAFNEFATICEKNVYTVVSRYCRSAWNWSADAGSRQMPLLGAASASAVSNAEHEVYLDDPTFNDAILEILNVQNLHRNTD
jgi:hypothetical protein